MIVQINIVTTRPRRSAFSRVSIPFAYYDQLAEILHLSNVFEIIDRNKSI